MKYITMDNMKMVYSAPCCTKYDWDMQTRILSGSLEGYNRKSFDWDSETDEE